MDKRLLERLNKIHKHIDALKGVETPYLTLQAHEKVLYSKLFLNTKGLGSSIEERKALVYASQDWIDFSDGLVEAEVNYLEGKRLLELKLKAFDGEYLTFKNELPAIKRQL